MQRSVREGRRMKRVGIRDVAARAGVGISTVSRVLSGRTDVRPVLRERVLIAAAELGYQPDILAQSLRRGATRSVGFVVDDLSNHLIAEIATGAESVFRRHGYSLLVMNSELDPELDRLNIRVLASRRVDALMICAVEESHPGTVEALASLTVPLCIVEGDQPPEVRASYVQSDHADGIRQAVDHLASLGHRRIALLTGPERHRSVRRRAAGFADAARAHPDCVLERRAIDLAAEDGEPTAAALLDSAAPPTALIVGGARILVGVLRALDARGLRVGEDVALVTTDAQPLAAIFRPPLAAIMRDAHAIGRSAAEQLLRRIAEPDRTPETIVLPTTYVPRAPASAAPRGPGRRAADPA